MGLVNTWTESKGRGGRAMYIETTFDPEWVREAQAAVAESLVEDETACSFPRRSIMRATIGSDLPAKYDPAEDCDSMVDA